MLARLQQLITTGAAVLAALALWAGWRAGQLDWGIAAVLAIAGSYAAVLGIEFLLLRHAHGADATPRATGAQLLSAWWGEVRSAPRVFCWQQPFRSRRFPDHLPHGAQGSRGVLLLHGFVCNRGVWNAWLERLTTAGVPVVAPNLEPVFGSIDSTAATIESAARRLEACTGQPFIVVAHSMGGVALRRWWGDHDGDARVQHAITVASPHQGTWMARFAFSNNGRQLRPQSPWLVKLRAGEPPARAARFTCFYGHCDNIVFPPTLATLPGADNRHLAGVAHVHMVAHEAPWQALQTQLKR